MTNSDDEKEGCEDYGASSIRVMTGMEAVRSRPEMFLGHVATPESLVYLICLLVECAIDDFRAGGAHYITVQLRGDGSVMVSDDGTGLPADILLTGYDKTDAERMLGDLDIASKPNFYPIGITTALSAWLVATIRRSGKMFQLTYRQGAQIGRQCELGSTVKSPGNKIVFLPDAAIFKGIQIDQALLEWSLAELADIHPRVKIVLERVQGKEVIRKEWMCKPGASIESCPVKQRVLGIEGHVRPDILKHLEPGLSVGINVPHTAYLFVSYSFADIPLSTSFSRIFPLKEPQNALACNCRPIAVTQQFSKPFQNIPNGWKTVCAFQFPDGIPSLVKDLPVLDGWDFKPRLGLCSEDVWEILISENVAKAKRIIPSRWHGF